MKFVALIAMIAIGGVAHAANFNSAADRENYFTVQSVQVREIQDSHLDAKINHVMTQRFDAAAGGSAAGSIIGVITDPANIQAWVTLGEKAWAIIAANKPVANVVTQRVSVLPMAQTDWQAMENWQGPGHKTYVMEARNLFGMTVVSHVYTLAYNYGGQYQGKGQYLANATIIPSNIQVSWGYTLNSKVEVGDTVNTGVKESPVPGVNLQVGYSIDTALKHMEGRDNFFVRGDGQIVRIDGRD